MTLRRVFWAGISLAQLALFSFLLLSGSACDDGNHNLMLKFRWRGQDWFLTFDKDSGNVFDILTPEGRFVKPKDPGWPPQIRVIDGKAHLPPGAVTSGSSASGASLRAANGDSPRSVYLLDVYGTDRILIIDQENGHFQAEIQVPIRPQGIELSHDGRWLYVTHLQVEQGNPFFPPAPPRISVIDTIARAIVQTIDLPPGVAPGVPVISPDDRRLYVPGSTVQIVDTAQRAVAGAIPLGRTVNRLAITPDGQRIFGVQTQSFPARLFVIDTYTQEVVWSPIVPQFTVYDMLIDATGTRLYMASNEAVLVLDAATTLEVTRIPIATNARINRLALSFDGGSLFANHELTGVVSLINTRTNQVVEDIQLPNGDREGSFILMVP